MNKKALTEISTLIFINRIIRGFLKPIARDKGERDYEF